MGKTKTAIMDSQTEKADVKSVGAHRDAPVFEVQKKQDPEYGDKKQKIKSSKQAKKKSLAPSKKQNVQKRGKQYQTVLVKVDKSKNYSLAEAIKLAQEVSFSKFPGTIDAHLNTTVKNIRSLVNLPHLSGKKLTVLAFGPEAKEAGADLIGTEETIEEISKGLPAGRQGKLNFDVLVATPDWMPKLAKAAKILGPRGLMPNPKNETVTTNLAKTITELKGGKTEVKTEKDGKVIHSSIGKVGQPVEEISANLKTLVNSIGRSKIARITLAPTMGPSVKVDLSSI